MALEIQYTDVKQDTIDAATVAFGVFSREAIEKLSRERKEPAWMSAKRLRAWTLFCEMPGQSGNPTLPVSRRLDLHEIKIQELTSPSRTNRVEVPKNFVNEFQRQDVIYTSLSEALQKYPELVERYFMSECVQINDSKYAALHAALWTDGIFLYIPRNVKLTVPIESSLCIESGDDAAFPHTLIIAEEGATVTFVETFRSGNGNRQVVVDSVVEIFAGSDATVHYISQQLLGDTTYHFAFKKAVAKKDAAVNWYEIGIGSKISQSDIQLILDESGASGELFGVYFPGGDQQMEFDTLQVHAAPSTKSNLLYKGALQNKAKTIFNGIIKVHKGAQRTDAYQANKNILLSSDAHVDSIPTLEIEANDVRCTHGATVGPVDEEVLYYLMSRGLDRKEATRMLIVGFLVPVIDKIPVEKIREEVLGYIESRIG